MSFPVPARTHDLISRWWFTVKDAVQNLWRRCQPAEGAAQNTGNDTAAPRLPRIEAGAISLALSIFEALVRRMLVIMYAEYGPMPPPPEGEPLLFRLDECPPVPVIRAPRAGDADYCLKASAAGVSMPADQTADGLVSSAPLLKRIAALIHVFEHGELYLQTMSARLLAPLKPLLAPQPKAFPDPALDPEKADNMQYLHNVALDAQSHDSS
jgi:hypothetical protein